MLKAIVGLLGMLGLGSVLGSLGMFAPQHAAAAQRVLGHTWQAAVAVETPGTLVRSSAAIAPPAAVSSTPFESQHPDTPVEAETPASGKDSIETGDDLNDFDDFAYQLRVVFDGTAKLNREVERGASLGGRALSRLEDNRSDKPPRG